MSDVLLYAGIAMVASGLLLALAVRYLRPAPERRRHRHQRQRGVPRKEYW
jgi:HAMP domain-containing protein